MQDPIQSFIAQLPLILVLLGVLLEMVYWTLTILITIWMVRDGNRRGINWIGFWATALILTAIPNMVFPILPLLPGAVLIAYLFVRARFSLEATEIRERHIPSKEQHIPGKSRFVDEEETIRLKVARTAQDAFLLKKSEPAINQKIPIEEGITHIGRSINNEVAFISETDKEVSRQHAKIEKVNKNYVLTDLNSANGTFIQCNGGPESQITGDTKHVLQDGDVIRLGPQTIVEFKKIS